MRKTSLPIATLALLTSFLVAGCQGPDTTNTTAGAPELPPTTVETSPPPGTGVPVATVPEVTPAPVPVATEDPRIKAAAQLADIAFEYGSLALNNPLEYGKVLRANGGCGIKDAFSNAIGTSDLDESLTLFIESLKNKAGKIKDEDLAHESAELITNLIAQLDAVCGPDGKGNLVAAKQLLLNSQSYRSALGLPSPKKTTSAGLPQ